MVDAPAITNSRGFRADSAEAQGISPFTSTQHGPPYVTRELKMRMTEEKSRHEIITRAKISYAEQKTNMSMRSWIDRELREIGSRSCQTRSARPTPSTPGRGYSRPTAISSALVVVQSLSAVSNAQVPRCQVTLVFYTSVAGVAYRRPPMIFGSASASAGLRRSLSDHLTGRAPMLTSPGVNAVPS